MGLAPWSCGWLKRAHVGWVVVGLPALREMLEARGSMEKLRARVRAEVFCSIENKVRSM